MLSSMIKEHQAKQAVRKEEQGNDKMQKIKRTNIFLEEKNRINKLSKSDVLEVRLYLFICFLFP